MTTVRISIVTETYVPDVNGVANSLRHLISALDSDRYRVQIIRTRPRADWTPEVEEVWCKGLSIPMYPDLQIGLPAMARIREAWDSFKPHLVFIATEGPLGNSGLKLAQQCHLPVLSAFHTNFHRYSSYYGMGWVRTLTLTWLRRFHNRTAGTLVPTREIADFLIASDFHNVQVLPHGVDCLQFHPRRRSSALRQDWDAAQGQPVMLYVGRIAAEKNIPLAIQTWQSLLSAYPDLKLVMVGDGPMREQMQQDYPAIIFAGVQTGEALARYFASADLFVFPSLTETFGLVTLEAMASALPVVAFDMAAAHMYIQPGVEGELADVDDVDGFIAAAQRLLDRDLEVAGKRARDKAEQLSWEKVGDLFSRYVDQELARLDNKSSANIHTLV
jgi:glycosyltransferase involved in cell wall biosynthesis